MQDLILIGGVPPVTSSLSCSYVDGTTYSKARLYDDKKQFVIHSQNHPHITTRVKPLLVRDVTSKYDSSMFLQPAVEPAHERVRSLNPSLPPPPLTHTPNQARAAPVPAPASGTAYMSLYDRLAQANGVHQLTKSAVPPSKPIEARQDRASVATARDADKPKRKGDVTFLAAAATVTAAEKQLIEGNPPPKNSVRPGKSESLVTRPPFPLPLLVEILIAGDLLRVYVCECSPASSCTRSEHHSLGSECDEEAQYDATCHRAPP